MMLLELQILSRLLYSDRRKRATQWAEHRTKTTSNRDRNDVSRLLVKISRSAHRALSES